MRFLGKTWMDFKLQQYLQILQKGNAYCVIDELALLFLIMERQCHLSDSCHCIFCLVLHITQAIIQFDLLLPLSQLYLNNSNSIKLVAGYCITFCLECLSGVRMEVFFFFCSANHHLNRIKVKHVCLVKFSKHLIPPPYTTKKN